MSYEDLTGQKFGRWTVVSTTSSRVHSSWICLCECGETGVVSRYNLIAGRSQGCFKCGSGERRQKNDLTGKTIGDWTVLYKAPSRPGSSYWQCRCSCGKETAVSTKSLLRGQSTKCRSCSQRKEDIAIGSRFGRYVVISHAGKDSIGRQMVNAACDCGAEAVVRVANFVKGYSSGCRRCAVKAARNRKSLITNPAERYVFNSYRNSARYRDYKWNLSEAEFGSLIRQKCYYCGTPPSKVHRERDDVIQYNGIDRKDNSVGYTADNVLPCCAVCNRAKNDMPFEEFIEWLSRLVAYRSERCTPLPEPTTISVVPTPHPYTKQGCHVI